MTLAPAHKTHGAVALALLVAIALVYGQTAGHGFVNWDDNGYLYDNHRVREGLTWANVLWAFTSFGMSNWHPLTWLSLMADASLFGMWAGGHHLMSAAWHGAAALALYFALFRLTGDAPRSALVALLFALHPQHVESVAWSSERKDLICAVFWSLTLAAYAGYARAPSPGRYLAVAAGLAAALMAKPMAVSLPLVLLALDFWPLARHRSRSVARLILEKLPLAALSLASAALTLVAQAGGGSLRSLEQTAVTERVANALVAYATYLVKTVLPIGLSFFNLPGTPDALALLGSGLLLGAAVAAAVVFRRRAPWIAVGLFWFAVSLVPVIGIVQVGDQAWASRYTYLPHIGLFIAALWLLPVPAGLPGTPRERALAAAWAALLLAAGVAAAMETRHWKSSESLYRRAIALDPANYVAHTQLARFLAETGRHGEALRAAEAARRHAPPGSRAAALALLSESRVYMETGDLAQAGAALEQAAAIAPENPVVHYNRGTLELMRNDNQGALPHLAEAIRLEPGYSDAHNNLGAALGRLGRFEEALAAHQAAAAADPYNADAHYNIGSTLERLGRSEAAEAAFAEAAQRAPRHVRARLRAARLALARGDAAAANRWAAQVLALDPGNAEARQLAAGGSHVQ